MILTIWYCQYDIGNISRYLNLFSRYDCVAYSAEASTPPCQLTSLADRMSRTDEGKRILNDKPNIHSEDIDLDYLASLGEWEPPILAYSFIY